MKIFKKVEKKDSKNWIRKHLKTLYGMIFLLTDDRVKAIKNPIVCTATMFSGTNLYMGYRERERERESEKGRKRQIERGERERKKWQCIIVHYHKLKKRRIA